MVAIQIRDVPDEVRGALAAEAEARGQSLQVFLQDVLEREARLARNRAWLKQVRESPIARVEGEFGSADLVRRQREERTEHLVNLAKGVHAR